MRTVQLEQLRIKIGRELEDLPFLISKRGKVVAMVTVDSKVEQVINSKDNTNSKVEHIKPVIDDFKLCKHGVKLGLCKHGCK